MCIRDSPEIVLSIFGMIIMVVDPLLDPDRSHQSLGVIALIGSLTALVSCFCMAKQPGTAFWNMVRVEPFSVFFHVLAISIATITILSSFEYLRVQRIRAGEYYGLILLGTVGMCLMSSLSLIHISCLATLLFLGGWHGPIFGPPILQAVMPVIWFCLKVFFFMFLYVWVRWTLPRFRYDQLMAFGWKVLLPLAVANIVYTALVVAMRAQYPGRF